MFEFFRHLFSSDFMPHGMCFLWQPGVLWLNVISDSLIAASYYAIPLLLFRFASKRRDISFKWIFVAFGMFIFACGTSHLLSAVTVWDPVYRLEGIVKAATALASVATFAGLIPMVPKLITLPSPSQLASVNRKLAREIEERRAAEGSVRRINEELESRVASRTASLERALEELRREMTRRQELETQLIQSQKMEAVGQLAGGVAHDFNNLLTVILGNDEMLLEYAKGDARAQDYGEEIRRAANRASALTQQLLAFSRRQPALPRVVDLNDVVSNLDKMLRRLIGEDIELQIHLGEGLPPVKVDPTQIDQIVMNMAVNSRDAMPRGGRLTIETANLELSENRAEGYLNLRSGRYAQINVRDTGVGMDATIQSRIFEPFFTTKEQGKGTGLGLSIVYGIVRQNGGEILVYSEPGRGTEFKIYLPAVSVPNVAVAAPAREPAPGPVHELVLLVEDEEQVRNLTRTMLTRRGYRVLDASSPEAALEIVRTCPETIDVVVTDIVMPQMNGLELAAALKAIRPELRFLFMSGYSDTGVIDQVLREPTIMFLQKPFTSDLLTAKIREVVERPAEAG